MISLKELFVNKSSDNLENTSNPYSYKVSSEGAIKRENQARTSRLAIASIACTYAGITCMVLIYLGEYTCDLVAEVFAAGFICLSITGIGLGVAALLVIRRSPVELKGSNYAIRAIVINVVLYFLMLCMVAINITMTAKIA